MPVVTADTAANRLLEQLGRYMNCEGAFAKRAEGELLLERLKEWVADNASI